MGKPPGMPCLYLLEAYRCSIDDQLAEKILKDGMAFVGLALGNGLHGLGEPVCQVSPFLAPPNHWR